MKKRYGVLQRSHNNNKCGIKRKPAVLLMQGRAPDCFSTSDEPRRRQPDGVQRGQRQPPRSPRDSSMSRIGTADSRQNVKYRQTNDRRAACEPRTPCTCLRRRRHCECGAMPQQVQAKTPPTAGAPLVVCGMISS